VPEKEAGFFRSVMHGSGGQIAAALIGLAAGAGVVASPPVQDRIAPDPVVRTVTVTVTPPVPPPPTTTGPTPTPTDAPTDAYAAQPEVFDVPLAEFSHYDIDGRQASRTETPDSDFNLRVVNPLGNSAPIRFAGEGRVVQSTDASPADCRRATEIRNGAANIYGPGDGEKVCITTTDGNLAIVWHQQGQVRGGINIGVRLYRKL
jgi:hypothetical protein